MARALRPLARSISMDSGAFRLVADLRSRCLSDERIGYRHTGSSVHDPSSVVLGVFEGPDLVATGAVRRCDRLDEMTARPDAWHGLHLRTPTAFVHSVAVEGDRAGIGLGRMVFASLFRQAHRMGCESVALHARDSNVGVYSNMDVDWVRGDRAFSNNGLEVFPHVAPIESVVSYTFAVEAGLREPALGAEPMTLRLGALRSNSA